MAVRQYTRGMRLWSVIYPVFLYFAVSQLLDVVQQMLPFMASQDAVMRQGVDTLGGLLVLYAGFLKKGRSGEMWRGVSASAGDGSEKTRIAGTRAAGELKESGAYAQAGVSGGQLFGFFIAALLLGCGSFALNNLIALTDLIERSDSYQFVEQSFYSSRLVWEIAVLCILTPIAEELLYRRIVFCGLRSWIGQWGAVLGSALLFGVMHMNLVQMLYASGLGILLGILMEYYGNVGIAMCGHIAANLLSVLRSELGLFSGLEKGSGAYWAVTLAALVVTTGLTLWYAWRMRREDAP